MRRRTFIAALGGVAAWPLTARATNAQGAGQMPRVGWIWTGSAAGNSSEVAGFKQGLREFGYVEGKNIVVEYRFGEHSEERLPALAADLARLNVSVIVAFGVGVARTVHRAAPDTPIVFFSGDPIGLATNLSRPGGNMTGVSLMRLGDKWPELAKEALPALTRIGYLFNPTNAPSVATFDAARRAAEAIRLNFESFPIERAEDLERTFVAIERDRVEALMLDAAHPIPTDWPRVAKLALSHKLPAISETRDFVVAGGLMSYGASLFDSSRRTAYYVDRILKGTRPGDLPVEQPTKFELVINLKTTKVLGLTIPPQLLARADDVIG
jgi:putative tryptophan/tyrosine transport system substrate-binding protein